MKTIKNSNTALIAPFLTAILLGLPVSAHADWSNTQMRSMPAPNLIPNQGQAQQHEVHVNVPAPKRPESPRHVEPQHRVQPAQPVVHQSAPVVNHIQTVHSDQRGNHSQAIDHRKALIPGYFRRDANYYGHIEVPFPYADVDSGFAVPDGFETVTFNGETFYYNQGVFYQQVGDQLTVIPPVLGAIVDSIPQDYQIVMADGIHYLLTGGVYYQRVDAGFQVVQGPVPQDQE